MIFPIGDDNTDRVMAPAINILLIVVNVVVFVFLQGLGANNPFTYAFATVPREILTGKDLVTVLSTEPGWRTDHPTGTSGDWAGRLVGAAVGRNA